MTALLTALKRIGEKEVFVLEPGGDASQIEDFTWFVDCTETTRVLFQDPEFGDRPLFQGKDEAVSLAAMLNFAHAFIALVPQVIEALEGLQWRPISEAPKDGTPVLLLRPRVGSPGLYIRNIGAWDEQKYHTKPIPYWKSDITQVTVDRCNPPTHWMPLPAAPTPLEDVQGGQTK